MALSPVDLSPPMPFSSHYALCDGIELHYTDWGSKQAPVVLMAHGLARTGRDFDELAYALSKYYRVICPDMLGRGLSQWASCSTQYNLNHYVSLLQALLDQLQIRTCRWVGTSMGGATGIVAAAGALKARISHLVINDIGPELPTAAIERILHYVGQPPEFTQLHQLEQWLRQSYAPYGWLSDGQWLRMAETSMRRLASGQLTAHYDPAIVQQFVHYPHDYSRWEAFATLDIPVALLRGQNSDLLTTVITKQMQTVLPQLVVAEFGGCGHAPALNVPEHIQFVMHQLQS